MKKSNLYLIAALKWGIPGIIISVKGIRAYMSMDPDNLWWLLLITASFYSGLGPMLVVAALRFIYNRKGL